MLHMSSEDIASVGVVLSALERQAAKLGPTSKVIHLWRDWSDLLAPADTGTADRPLDLVLDQATPGGAGL